MSDVQNSLKTTQDFKNNHIEVKIEKLATGSNVKLDITVAPEAVNAAHLTAVKNVGKEISLPGFRKGKAPDEVIIKNYNKPVVQEWQRLVLQVGYQEALELAKLQPFRHDSARCTQMPELKKNASAALVIEFEAGPQVPHIDLEALSLPVIPVPPITGQDVAQVVNNLRLYHAKWADVTDRGIQENDYVDLDIENLDENVNICKDTRFEVKPDIMANWMRQLLIGKHSQDIIEGLSEKDNRPLRDDEEEIPNFKPTRVKMTVKAIKQPVLPEINEEFIKKTSASDVTDLESKIKMDLEKRAQQKAHLQLVRLIDDQLIDTYKFAVPQSLIQAEVNNRLYLQREWMKKQQAPETEIEQLLPKLALELPAEAEKGCRLLFLLLGFAEQHKMSISQEEIIQELTQRVMQGGMNQEELKDTEAVKAKITQNLLLRKAKDYIVNYVSNKG